MATTVAVGFQIVILLSAGSFQAVLPSLSGKPSPTFPDTAAGTQAFMDWLSPQFPRGRWNPPPTQVCVVGVEPFTPQQPPHLPQPLYASQPPFRVLEPYSAVFHYIGEAEQKQGLRRRSLADALALCNVRTGSAAASSAR